MPFIDAADSSRHAGWKNPFANSAPSKPKPIFPSNPGRAKAPKIGGHEFRFGKETLSLRVSEVREFDVKGQAIRQVEVSATLKGKDVLLEGRWPMQEKRGGRTGLSWWSTNHRGDAAANPTNTNGTIVVDTKGRIKSISVTFAVKDENNRIVGQKAFAWSPNSKPANSQFSKEATSAYAGGQTTKPANSATAGAHSSVDQGKAPSRGKSSVDGGKAVSTFGVGVTVATAVGNLLT